MDPEAQTQTEPLLEGAGARDAEIGSGPREIGSEDWSSNAARWIYSSATHIGTSMLLGLITGICLKTVGQSLAIALVLLFLGFQVLAYYGFVNFNWQTIGSSLGKTMDLKTEDGKINMKTVGSACLGFVTWILSWGVPSVLGFLGGFYVGWKIL